MSNIKHITILENDVLHEKNPLDRILRAQIKKYTEIKFDIWEWFSQDTTQNKEKSINRIRQLSEHSGQPKMI